MGPSLKRLLTLALVVFAGFSVAILSRPPKWLNDFDQPVYLTIAYDLDRYGVFSNGVFDETDREIEAPKPGIIFAPLYPAIIFVAMKIDSRFADAVRCAVESIMVTVRQQPAKCTLCQRISSMLCF